MRKKKRQETKGKRCKATGTVGVVRNGGGRWKTMETGGKRWETMESGGVVLHKLHILHTTYIILHKGIDNARQGYPVLQLRRMALRPLRRIFDIVYGLIDFR